MNDNETSTAIFEVRGYDKNKKWWCKLCPTYNSKGHPSLALHKMHVRRFHNGDD